MGLLLMLNEEKDEFPIIKKESSFFLFQGLKEREEGKNEWLGKLFVGRLR